MELKNARQTLRKFWRSRTSAIRRLFTKRNRAKWLSRADRLFRRDISDRLRKTLRSVAPRRPAFSFHATSARQLVQKLRTLWKAKSPATETRTPPWFRLGLPAAIALVVGTALTLAAFLVTRDMYRSVAEQEFDRQASHYVLALHKAVDRHLELVSKATTLFKDSTVVTGRWDMFNFSRNQLAHHPGYKALGWVPVVPDKARQTYIRRAEADGLSGFRFTEITGTGHSVPTTERKQHLPIYYIEPYEGNEGLLGFDMASRPELQAALEQARLGRKLVVIDWDDPRGAPYSGEKVLMFIQPMFANSRAGVSAEESWPDGFVIGLLQVEGLFTTTLQEFTTPAWLDTYLFLDVNGIPGKTLDKAPVHVEPSALRPAGQNPPDRIFADAEFAISKSIAIGDRNYWLTVRPVPGKMDMDLDFVPWGVMIFGLALTLLLTRYIAVSRHKQMQIEIAVIERTAELSRANQANLRLEREIGERKRVEAALRTAKDEAEVANRAKSEFLAMVSHELRTPLNAIIGFSEILTSEMFGTIGDRRYRGYADDIHSSGLHLLSLINDILDLSKVEANRFELNEAKLSLPRLIGDTMHLVAEKARAGRIELVEKLPVDLPDLHADERAVKQIVLNLLSNAIKFTLPGGKVEIAAETNKNREFVITIADNGIGIANKDHERIMKPFTQVDSSLARKFEGTGLGLPLTKSLIELHGGTLALESDLGKGTVVRAIFPRDRVIHNHIAAE